ncbi:MULTISPECIES: helix-turn-helix domain-containing protein [Candidatus Williamhamiltonella]|uniref:Transcriptional regulator, AraC family n=2 Tax=Candidatus Williamhamiltonella defendens TaxID=138072 RepID=C4K8S4_HAMD5|nr:helix-turn-helix domain-containing protein [Candidatus Hamiltonella defensa]ACQ66911.1 transcriptional regulator, AraC family [Candidatus Hamiltonella defensa 5AT (Acyrthosiphon pisum)]ATW21715.1 AraC family transcriptional regulator [Candidatus Hamiltonella defensa]ATW33030.1 AraC family transcriptional regulator [Candidatus Hamiltonella defensa]AYB49121.1 AraC family transcriptional regulator [Candidatus Hamiltonella defensa]
MQSIQFILFLKAGSLKCSGEYYDVPSGSLVVSDESAVASTVDGYHLKNIICYSADLLPIYKTLTQHSSQSNSFQRFAFDRCKILSLQKNIIQVTERLMSIQPGMSLRFIYLYCLGLDSEYFYNLLNLMVGNSNELLEFFEQNSLNAWSVSRYAEELGVSSRKLNFLFYQKFGTSVKQWLLDKRLKKGLELLKSTRLRVSDIAMECGFSNHAHFSDSFRRRYQHSPSQLRTLI